MLQNVTALLNSGDGAATNVVITDPIDGNFANVSLFEGGNLSGSTVTFNNVTHPALGSLGPGDGFTVNFDATLNAVIADGTPVQNQAEAVADLIDSGAAQAARAALRSLSGAFSRAVNELADKLAHLRMHVEAAIDFPEEEIDFLSDKALLQRIDDCAAAFDALRADARQGRVLRDGFQIVIVGKPNAGKSSLLNLLSGQDAAIVTEVAGTTRDVLREQIDIDGLAVELVDTAGLRNDPDRIEAEGIRRARAAPSTHRLSSRTPS